MGKKWEDVKPGDTVNVAKGKYRVRSVEPVNGDVQVDLEGRGRPRGTRMQRRYGKDETT